jgi:short subunit dehydrogenase-like uncharacterized protein
MNWILYGANGYTGRLVAREAVRRGLRPTLAGRNKSRIQALAAELGLDCRVFGLDDEAAVRANLTGHDLVLHCAGPFSATSSPMLSACLANRAHYLDITGEIQVFEFAFAQADAALRADVALIPGVGFDVVPSDCLASSLVEALPAATRLRLAFEAGGGPSPGTAKTSLEGLVMGGRVRRDGRMVPVPLAWKSRTIPFAHGERTAVTIPWGDVFTAFISTGVPDIEVYMAVPPATVARMRRLRWMRPLLGTKPVQSFLKSRIEDKVRGPSDDKRSSTRSELWGEASSADGRRVSATMTTPNGYDLTVTAALGIVAHLLGNDVEGGFYTPSLLMGSGYAASLPGVEFRLTSGS